MHRLLLAACALLASGCFFSLGNPLSFVEGERPLAEKTVEGEGRPKILLLDIADVITDQPTKRAFGLVEEESTVARVHAELEKAGDDDRIAAIVLRINSPGGGVTASDDIYTDLMRFKAEQQVPVVAALGNVAASGGYYVACAADRIVAHPTTVTGSIGVIMMGLNVEGLLGKIGVKPQTFKAGEHKDLLSPFRGATAEERRIVQGIIDSMHARFIGVVKASRPQLDAKRLGELTDGRIFDAGRALDAGLVDQVGDLRAAIEVAKAAANVTQARVVMYRRSGETAETIYSAARDRPLQVNLLPIDLGTLAANSPRFMYLWAPGLSSGLSSGLAD